MSLFISQAHAAAGAPGEPGSMQMILMLVVFAAIFFFMIYRPQAKRTKAHKNLMESLSKGDEILTQGGLIARVVKISDESEYVKIELNENNVIAIKKNFITAVLPKGSMKAL